MSTGEQYEQIVYRRAYIQNVTGSLLTGPAEQDPQYPYYGRWEAERMAKWEESEPLRTSALAERWDREEDFDPDVQERFYVSFDKVSLGSGEGAIYSLEYLNKPRRSPWRR